jgi:hypothetical protein
MYYQNYEDYMRTVLGYPNNNAVNSTYENEYYPQPSNENLEELYPEIYKILNPMVIKCCQRINNRPITNSLLDEMSEEIYRNIESEIDIKFELESKPRTELRNGDVVNPNAKTEEKETRQRNYLMQDLIRILLLNYLFNRRPNIPPPGRPPFPPQGGPGFPPQFPGMRPPIQPRDYNNYFYNP